MKRLQFGKWTLWALDASNLESFRALKASNLATGTICNSLFSLCAMFKVMFISLLVINCANLYC